MRVNKNKLMNNLFLSILLSSFFYLCKISVIKVWKRKQRKYFSTKEYKLQMFVQDNNNVILLQWGPLNRFSYKNMIKEVSKQYHFCNFSSKFKFHTKDFQLEKFSWYFFEHLLKRIIVCTINMIMPFKAALFLM